MTTTTKKVRQRRLPVYKTFPSQYKGHRICSYG